MMTPDMVITHKNTMRTSPPDILLTNYKMLDYLLIRPGDYSLWKENGPETLKYLIVDELHTFDGAQGTDLACLIRRLKARVKSPTTVPCRVNAAARRSARMSPPSRTPISTAEPSSTRAERARAIASIMAVISGSFM